MIEKIKSIFNWVHLTFLVVSISQKRYIPIKICFEELQKGFFNFFEVGGRVKGYEFVSNDGYFSILENNKLHLLGERMAYFAYANKPVISFDISKTENDFLIYLELAYRFPSYMHYIKKFVKGFFFLLAILVLIAGTFFFVTHVLCSEEFFGFMLVSLLILGLLALTTAYSSSVISKANNRLLKAIRTIESGQAVKRF